MKKIELKITVEEFKQMHYKDMLTMKEIAKKLKVDRKVLRNWMYSNGLKSRRYDLSFIDKNELLKLYETNTKEDICKMYKIYHGTLNKLMDKYNIDKNKYKKIRYNATVAKYIHELKITDDNDKKGCYRIVLKDGYIIWTKIVKGKKIFLHKYIAEKLLGRKLKKDEIPHHLNCDRNDNRNENICVVSSSLHTKLHQHLGKVGMKILFTRVGIDSKVVSEVLFNIDDKDLKQKVRKIYIERVKFVK